jgi:hypothetical protein
MLCVSLHLGSLLLACAADPAPPVPFEVVSAKPAPALTQQFQRTDGWTGGDGASSIPLGPDRTLWLFADSWVGKIEGGRRVGARLINNAAAWQLLADGKEPLRFFLDQSGKEPVALLRPEAAGTWYWPGDGVVVDGKLYLFCKLVRRKAEGAPGFQFDWFANELLQIDNPRDEPGQWKVKRCRLPEGKDAPRLGSACVLEGDYLYVFGLFPAAAVKPLDAPLGVARLPRERLAALDMKGWQYWCRGPKGERWSDQPADLVALFRDAAPEMTVSRVRGIDGLVAVYTPIGIGRDIAVRHAPKPWGPWSQSLRVYRCPDAGDGVFVYGAKAHPELSTRDGQLFLTWCRNTGSLADHVRKPDLYFPQGVEVQLRPR